MKRLAVLVSGVLFSTLAACTLFGQSNTQVGTWELRVAESRFANGQKPMNETRAIETQGAEAKVSVEGTAGDGSKVAYSYTTGYDGSDARITGIGQPYGADTVQQKRVDANTTTIVEKKAGRKVATGTNVISNDGTVMTVTLEGADRSSVVTVWDK